MEENMTKNKNSCQEGLICELFAYLPYLGVYPNSSDVNELFDIPPPKLYKKFKIPVLYYIR